MFAVLKRVLGTTATMSQTGLQGIILGHNAIIQCVSCTLRIYEIPYLYMDGFQAERICEATAETVSYT